MWSQPPAFPSGAGGLLSTADDFLAFARLLRDNGTADGRRLLSADSVARMTAKPPDAGADRHRRHPAGRPGLAYGMAVATEPDDVSAAPGRYGWDGGYGTVWFTDPHRDLIAIALTQTSDFLFDGGRAEFIAHAVRAAD